MREYIARLIDTGMNRETALMIVRYYRRRGLLTELARYVSEVEEECRVKMEAV